MKVVMVYVYAGKPYLNYAGRFLHSYHEHPPQIEHSTVVVVNNEKCSGEISALFSSLPGLSLIQHDNSGHDIGAFQLAARTVPCDMMAFFGASTFFSRSGWLLRMAVAFVRHGNAQYGAMGNRGNLNVKVWPHIRTTAFWMDPKLFNSYPHRIVSAGQRHPFEHGPECFTGWVKKQGLNSWVITWANEFLWDQWDSDSNGFHQGDQSNLLAGDHICERPYYPEDRCRKAPGEATNRPFCEPWKSTLCWPCLTAA